MLKRMGLLGLGVFLALSFALPVLAEQEVNGLKINNPTIAINDLVVSDKGTYNPLIRLLNGTPTAGSTIPVSFQVLNLTSGENYIYIFVNDRLVKWQLVRNGDAVALFPDSGGWKTGNYVIEVVLSTGQRWPVSTYGDVASYTTIGSYIPPTCCEGVEVERFFVEVKPLVQAPVCPVEKPPSFPQRSCHICCSPVCWCGLTALISFIVIANIIICCP